MAWGTLSWTENLPANTDVTIDVAVQDSVPFGTWTYSGAYTSPAGSSLSGRTGRYLRYRVTMSNTAAAASPEVSKLRLTFGTGWQDRVYGFDGRGNMTSKEVVTTVGTVTETRTVNNLNQITQNVVVDSVSGTTTWLFTHDLNGNRTQKRKSDNSEIWDYTWNEENRLTRVVKTVNSVVTLDVAFTYDSIGRMLTRKLSTDANPTVFEWDGWDLVREVDPAGVETVYYAPLGEITSFKRGSSVYQVHSDALSSVRMVTDVTGSGVLSCNFDAWGASISSSGTLSGIFSYQFVGSLGVRVDAPSQLYFMRQRWYDPNLGRFIGRDPLGISQNLYSYAENNPARMIDPRGEWPWDNTQKCAALLDEIVGLHASIQRQTTNLNNNGLVGEGLPYRQTDPSKQTTTGICMPDYKYRYDVEGHLIHLAIDYGKLGAKMAQYYLECNNFGPPPPYLRTVPVLRPRILPGDKTAPKVPWIRLLQKSRCGSRLRESRSLPSRTNSPSTEYG